MKLNIVIFGLSITSSWGNGHATTYRALIKALAARGHNVTFLERDVDWYRAHRDMPTSTYCRIELYEQLRDVPLRYGGLVRNADLVILGSFVPDGAVLGDWITATANGVTAFYDIDTPVTLQRLKNGGADYVSAALIPRFRLYLSFTGGPALMHLEDAYGSPRARALHCAVDLDIHTPAIAAPKWTLGYLGTYSADRQPLLERLLIEPARRKPEHRFVVAGAQYPDDLDWPDNVDRIAHLPPTSHPEFFGSQRYTLNLTRADMTAAGYSPSVRLFEASACGTPVISDIWPGIETFFVPGREILLADDTDAVLSILGELPEVRRRKIGLAARRRVLRDHSGERRAIQLEQYYQEALSGGSSASEVEAVA